MATSNLIDGLGSSAFGGSDYAAGTSSPAIAPAVAPAVFSRVIDPTTGDYVVGSDGASLQTYSRVTQQVVLALVTLKGTRPSDPAFGISWPEKISDSFEQDVDGAVRLALNHIVGLEILEVSTELSAQVAGRFNTRVRFRDATGAEQTVQLDGSRQ